MSFSSSKALHQVGNEIWVAKEKPQWLEAFLDKTFFGCCSIHEEARRNELNKYCINCDCPVCQHCVSSGSHLYHKLLKIYRHVYKDVVPLSDMEKHIDCSKIQLNPRRFFVIRATPSLGKSPYKSNKQLVVALNPLPHSGALTNDEASCNICKRRLNEPDNYRYCSIACKVMAFSRKPCEYNPPFLTTSSPTKDEARVQTEKTEGPVHRRKGVPRRAPLF